MCTCTVSLVANTCTSPGVYGKEDRSSNCPHIWLNLRDSQMMDVLPKVEVCVYICRCAELATATSHQDLLTRAREQGVCFHNAPTWSSWPIAITNSARWRTYAYVYWQTAFLVTHSSSVDLSNSIKYVSDFRLYLSYVRSIRLYLTWHHLDMSMCMHLCASFMSCPAFKSQFASWD